MDISPDKLREPIRIATFRVKSSRFAPPRPEYMAKGGPNVLQWHLELEPLSFKYDDGGNDTRAVNLFANEDNYARYQETPDGNLMVGKRSPLFILGTAFKEAGCPVTSDPSVVEGLIFECELVQTGGKDGKWMQLPRKLLAEYTPPADIRIIPHFGKRDSEGATPLGDGAGTVSTLTEEQAIDLAVNALAGKPAGEDLTTLSGLPELMQEPWMSKVIGGELLQECFKSGKLALIDGVLKKIER